MGQMTYIVLLFVWALPIIGIQWIMGYQTFRSRRGVLTLGVLIPSTYLSLADVLAIRTGIWTFSPDLTLNLWIGGLPLEEGLFFLVTNVMVVQGILLLTSKSDTTAGCSRIEPCRFPGGGSAEEAQDIREPL